MNHLHRLFAFVLCLCMLILSVPVAGALTEADYHYASSGPCGPALTYVLNEDGVLTVSGEGPMYEFDWGPHPSKNSYPNGPGSAILPTWDYRLIKKVIVEEGCTSIGRDAFRYCPELVSVTLPDTVTVIGSGAFNSDQALESYNIPANLEEVGYGAFQHTSGPKEIVLPDTVVYVGDYAFAEITNLESFTFSKSMKRIPEGMLCVCKKLSEITIPGNIRTIETKAFWYCSGLHYAHIEEGVEMICENAFGNVWLWGCDLPKSAIDIYPNSIPHYS